MALPPLMHIVDIQVRQDFIWQIIPDPILVVRLPIRTILQQFIIHVQRRVPSTMGPTFNLVKRSGAGHADVDCNVNLVSLICIPEAGYEISHDLVIHSNGVGMH